jgi:anti-sigma B factor antagonist
MGHKHYQCIRTQDVDGVTVVHFLDDKVMDPARIEQLGSELNTLTDESQPPKLIVNFSDVKFFSSAAINKLIVLEKRVKEKGGQTRLSNLRPEVRDLFGFTHLDSLFRIHDSQEDAVLDLKQK